MCDVDNFLGNWELVTDEALYEFGEPPVSGSYGISRNGDTLTFSMKWTDNGGESHSMEYSEQCDGVFHDYPVREIADEIRLSLETPELLKSEARKGGITILSATRELLEDGWMRVTMSGLRPDGSCYDNVSLYRKS